MDLTKSVYCCLVRFRFLLAQLFDVGPEFLRHILLYFMCNFFNFNKGFGVFHITHNNNLHCRNIKLLNMPKKSRNNIFAGQNPLLSHTIAIGFSLLLILVVVTTLSSLRDNYQDFIGKNEIIQVCSLLKSSVEKVFVEDNYVSPSNTTKGRVVVSLPNRIADMNYRVRVINSTFFIETSGAKINDTCRPGFNLSYNGSTTGGLTELIYVEKDSGNKHISVTRV